MPAGSLLQPNGKGTGGNLALKGGEFTPPA